jgi:hypothetical protein
MQSCPAFEYYYELRRKDMEKKFWMVLRELDGTGVPSRRHESKLEAIDEAGRLASKENARFFILEAIGVVARVLQPVNYTEFE